MFYEVRKNKTEKGLSKINSLFPKKDRNILSVRHLEATYTDSISLYANKFVWKMNYVPDLSETCRTLRLLVVCRKYSDAVFYYWSD